MATASLPIPEHEYLNTIYEPDCDFVDGVLEERNVGEGLHSELQVLIGFFLLQRQREWKIRVFTEWRTHVGSRRYRIPDLTVVPRNATRTGVLQTPPLLCIEILSPEDRIPRILRRLKDFFDMGVESIWVLDPETRTGYHASPFGIMEPEDGVLRVKDSPVQVVLSELWAEFDAE